MKNSNLPCSNSVGTPLEFAAFRSGFDAKYSRASGFWFFLSTTMVFYGVSNTFCQEKHQHFHADRQLVMKKEISIKINFQCNVKRPWPTGLVTGISRRWAGFDTQQEQVFFFFFSLFFYLFSQINNCQQKQNKKTKQTNIQTKKQTKQKGGLRF